MVVGFRRAWVAVAVIVAVLASAAVGSGASPPLLSPVVLPQDHGAHPGFQVEWWYTAGTVTDSRGHDFFWFATVWSGAGQLVARVNVVDLQADRVVLSKEYTERATPAAGQTALAVGGFALGWQPGGSLGQWTVDAPVSSDARLHLSLIPAQPYVLNGLAGIVRQGPLALSDYYSDPRLTAIGTLVVDGRSNTVNGQGWLDHQWGNFALSPGALHWNWFACQFDDGSDLMLYQFINRAGDPTGVQNATFVSPLGSVTHPQFTVSPLEPTIQPPGATGTYPLDWQLAVPAARVDVELQARARNQFISNRYVPNFWEGAAAITSGAPGACIVESTRESNLSGF